MALKFLFFILVHSMVSDERRHSNKIKTKEITKICHFNPKIEMLQFVIKNNKPYPQWTPIMCGL